MNGVAQIDPSKTIRFRADGGCTCFGFQGPSMAQACLPYMNETEIDMLYDVDIARVSPTLQISSYPPFPHGHISTSYLPSFSPGVAWNSGNGILVIGDSHCQMFSGLIMELSVEYNRSVSFICEGNLRHLGRPLRYAERFLHDLDPQLIVFIFFHGFSHRPSEEESMTPAKMENAIRIILANYTANILLVGDVPAFPNSWPPVRALIAPKKNSIPPTSRLGFSCNLTERWPEDRSQMNSMYLRMATRNPERISFADIAPYYLKQDASRALLQVTNPFLAVRKRFSCRQNEACGHFEYTDHHHVSISGARRAEQFFRWHIFGDANCYNASSNTSFGNLLQRTITLLNQQVSVNTSAKKKKGDFCVKCCEDRKRGHHRIGWDRHALRRREVDFHSRLYTCHRWRCSIRRWRSYSSN
jgi:hypothetical protein